MGFFDAIKKLNIFTTYTKLTEDFYDELEGEPRLRSHRPLPCP